MTLLHHLNPEEHIIRAEMAKERRDIAIASHALRKAPSGYAWSAKDHLARKQSRLSRLNDDLAAVFGGIG